MLQLETCMSLSTFTFLLLYNKNHKLLEVHFPDFGVGLCNNSFTLKQSNFLQGDILRAALSSGSLQSQLVGLNQKLHSGLCS